jgi:hypothetical protein
MMLLQYFITSPCPILLNYVAFETKLTAETNYFALPTGLSTGMGISLSFLSFLLFSLKLKV